MLLVLFIDFPILYCLMQSIYNANPEKVVIGMVGRTYLST